MGLFSKTPEEKFEKASMASSGRKMLKLAEGGMQKAMTSVAHKYYGGFGFKKNLTKAKEWADKAADEARFGVSEDTVEAYYTKGEVYLEFDKEEYTDIAKDCFKKAFYMGKKFDGYHVYCKYMSGVSLARINILKKADLEETKEILEYLKSKKFPEGKFELARYLYYIESDLVTAVKYFQELLDEKQMDGDFIIFEMEDISTEYLKKAESLKEDEVSLKTIDELEALYGFLKENQWEDYILEEIGALLKKFRG